MTIGLINRELPLAAWRFSWLPSAPTG